MPESGKPRRTTAVAGSKPARSLRRRAEGRLRSTLPAEGPAPAGELGKVIQELRIHQLELEIQNEELRRAQTELSLSRDRYNDLYEFAPSGHLTLDQEGVIREANLTAVTMLGTARGKLIGSRFSRHLRPESQDAFFFHRQKVLASSAKETVEVELRGASGQPQVIELQSFRRGDAPGGLTEWRMALLDVSARKQAELRLATLNAELERRVAERTVQVQARTTQLTGIIGSAMDAIISIDRAGKILIFNAAAESMFRCSAREAIGSQIDRFIPQRFWVAHQGHIKRFGQTGETSRSVGRLGSISGLRSDGEEFPIEASISHVEVGGDPIYTVILRDITERQRLEREVLEISAREQQRIGQDLHDDLCQWLAGTELVCSAVAKDLATENPVMAARVARITESLGQALNRAHRLAHGLAPSAIISEGLVGGLRALAASTEELFQIRCTYEGPEDVPVRDEVAALHLYRIGQEAVSNAVRHGGATEVLIVLRSDATGTSMLVRDNGRGISPPKSPRNGLGIRGMRYRAGIIGASLDIRPNVTGGTDVVCTFPKKL